MSATRTCARFALAALLIGAAGAAPAQTQLLRFPDICADRVVFTYAGDLWTASSQGGTAVRLTSGPGLEMAARFSPDCRQIAFTGQYGGDSQVYVIPAAGGEPRQLTWYPALGPLPQRWGFDNQVYGWTPDGSAVLFRSWRESRNLTNPRVFTVPVAGGLPVALPMPHAGAAAFSPDGSQVVYSPKFRDFRAWNRYSGGWAQDLHIHDLGSATARNITNDPNTDRDPVWIGDAIYFLSDRGPHLDLYRYDTGSGETTRLTRHEDADARWASGDASGRIIYEMGGRLHVFDTNAGSERALDIRVPAELVATRAAERDVSAWVEDFALSANGKRAAFTARGEVFSLPLEHGVALNLTHSPGVHEREVAWAHDGKRVAYIADASGEEQLWVRPATGGAATQLSHGEHGRLYRPRWSPDDRHLAWVDAANRIHVAASDGSGARVIATDPGKNRRDYAWSAKGRYLAFTLTDPETTRGRLHVHDLDSGKTHTLGAPLADGYGPAFSPDGQFLYFLGNREFSPQLSESELDYASTRTTQILAYALRDGVDNPFTAPEDDAAAAADDAAAEAPITDRIDFDGIEARRLRVPVDPGDIGGIAVTADELLYVEGGYPLLGRTAEQGVRLRAWSFAERESRTLYQWEPGAADAVSVSADGSTALLRDGGSWKRLDLSGGGEPEAESFDTTGLWARVDPKAEYAEIFHDVWRRYRDYFYAANMHGYDWAALRERYAALLPHVGDRSDLNYLISEMIAELSTSHTYIEGGDLGLPEKPHVALLGARFELDPAAGRYRIAAVFPGDNDEPRYRSPLTEVGSRVEAGEYVLAINGAELTAADNPYRLLRGAPDQRIQLRVGPRADGRDARIVRVQPLASEMELHYLDWVTRNRAYVDRASDGRIGYLHIPDMGADGAREFIKWFYPQLRKQALVIDVRDNGGGFMSQTMINRLSRKLLAYNYTRGSSITGTYPEAVAVGHLAAVANGTSASDGDIFSYMFQQARLGPVIGTRTWGGVVGISGTGPLIDGGSVSIPEYAAIVDLDGHYQVEGHGVEPDIEVHEDVAAELAGRDVQLDKAIEVLEAEIEAAPVKLLPQPPGPVKAPPGMRPAGARP